LLQTRLVLQQGLPFRGQRNIHSVKISVNSKIKKSYANDVVA